MAIIDKSTPIGLTAENLASITGNLDAVKEPDGGVADSEAAELSQEQSSDEAPGESRN